MLLNQLNKLNKPLMEGFNNAIHTFNATEMKLADILEALENTGYTHYAGEFLNPVVYAGYDENKNWHMYLVAAEDDSGDERYSVGKLSVNLDKNGKIAAEWIHSNLDESGLSKREAEDFMYKNRHKG